MPPLLPAPPPFATAGPAAFTTREAVLGVAGAFVLRNVLSRRETAAWKAHVAALHAAQGPPPGEAAQQRRDSQHHIPHTVDPSVVAPLAARIREWLPAQAGPANAAPLAEAALSPFLRCYRYVAGDRSAPHYDRSHAEHGPGRGPCVRFTAYSVILYLDDACAGGCTTFLEDPATTSNSGLTPRAGAGAAAGAAALEAVARVAPRRGDALLFPHGNRPGCHKNWHHEGSTVTAGEKSILRTDVVFDNAVPQRKAGRRAGGACAARCRRRRRGDA